MANQKRVQPKKAKRKIPRRVYTGFILVDPNDSGNKELLPWQALVMASLLLRRGEMTVLEVTEDLFKKSVTSQDRAAVSGALSNLAKLGMVTRISRGAYSATLLGSQKFSVVLDQHSTRAA